MEYEQNADRVEAIGNVFPVIFFLVAALICLTTMTRMVEENRTQIGTLKALGYGKARIGAKYICYAFLASFIGSIIGLTVGQKFLPVVIIQAYKILYNNLPEILAPLYAGYSLSAMLLAVAVITLAALSACNREMREVPAQLMRPEAPKNGKRIFLERISVISEYKAEKKAGNQDKKGGFHYEDKKEFYYGGFPYSNDVSAFPERMRKRSGRPGKYRGYGAGGDGNSDTECKPGDSD